MPGMSAREVSSKLKTSTRVPETGVEDIAREIALVENLVDLRV